MARIPLPTPADMSPEQLRVHEAVLAGPRGAVIGPLRALIHSPDLAERWSQLGEFLRYRTSLPARLNELAIIVTARRWTSQVEWLVHARAAAAAGLPQDAIAAIREGRAPHLEDADDRAVYEFACELQQSGKLSDETYARIHERLGAQGVVELTAVIGYYTMVSMTLNAHEIPLPDGEALQLAPLPQAQGGLTPLPAVEAASVADQPASEAR